MLHQNQCFENLTIKHPIGNIIQFAFISKLKPCSIQLNNAIIQSDKDWVWQYSLNIVQLGSSLSFSLYVCVRVFLYFVGCLCSSHSSFKFEYSSEIWFDFPCAVIQLKYPLQAMSVRLCIHFACGWNHWDYYYMRFYDNLKCLLLDYGLLWDFDTHTSIERKIIDSFFHAEHLSECARSSELMQISVGMC